MRYVHFDGTSQIGTPVELLEASAVTVVIEY